MISKKRRILSSVCAVAIMANGFAGFSAIAQDENRKKESFVFTRDVLIEGKGDGVIAYHNMLLPGQDTVGFVAAEMSFDSKVVKGAPFSAEALTEFTQVLGDGNRIVRRTTASLYRDGEGRTRREGTFSSPNGMVISSPDQRQMVIISIFDPVTSTNYRLDPNTRTAHKMLMGPPPPPPPPPPANTISGAAAKQIKVSGGALQGTAIHKVQPSYPPIAKAARAQGAVQVQITISESGDVIDASVVSGHPLLRDSALTAARQWKFKPTELAGQTVKVQGILTFNFSLSDGAKKDDPVAGVPIPRTAAPLAAMAGDGFHHVMLDRQVFEGEVKQESLGKETFEGIEAEGTRTVQTIPAGTIGNERPIEIVHERWYSPELRTVVMTRQSDPRFGETVFRLTNITRSEPDASLFQIPSDYTVNEVDIYRKFEVDIQRKLEKKIEKRRDQ